MEAAMVNIFKHFTSFTLTSDQTQALTKLSDFVHGNDRMFILKGYAGSGKTTLLKGFVEYLQSINKKHQLMAPTGRAAKVIHEKTGFDATTIHSGVYSFNDIKEIKKSSDENDVSFRYEFQVKKNPEIYDSIIIIDEASMVSDISNHDEFFRFGSGKLLQDLIEFSRLKDTHATSKIIFIGDPAQLPPIKMNHSPALDENYLLEKYDLPSQRAELKEVKRQGEDNGILKIAGELRASLETNTFNNLRIDENKKDIFTITHADVINHYLKLPEPKVLVCFKNKTSQGLNRDIRNSLHKMDLPIQPGDKILICNNNYNLGVLNGEIGLVTSLTENLVTRNIAFNEKGGGKVLVPLSWRKVELKIHNGAQPKIIEGYMLENYLHEEKDLTHHQRRALYVDFIKRNPGLKKGTEPFKEAIKSDPFFNCIHLKYGYAITCHKAQGGEWENVMVYWDRGKIDSEEDEKSKENTKGRSNSDFYRWAYTAITRASKKLFNINPPGYTQFIGMTFIESNTQKSEEISYDATPTYSLDDKLLNDLKNLGLNEASVGIQDHGLNLKIRLQDQSVKVLSWARVNYEIRYTLEKNGKISIVKYWVNKNEVVGQKFQILPSQNQIENLKEILEVIHSLPKLNFTRSIKSVETNYPLLFSEIDNEKHYLQELLTEIKSNLSSEITINKIQHLDYKERYHFEMNGKTYVVDFEYNGSGFFGRVLPLEKQCTCPNLHGEIKRIIIKLKGGDYGQ